MVNLSRKNGDRASRLELIGRVQIVQDDHQRTRCAGFAQEAGEGIEQHEPRLLSVRRGGAFKLRKRCSKLGDQLREERCPAPEQIAELGGIDAGGELSQHARPRPQTGRATAVPAPAPGDRRLLAAGRAVARQPQQELMDEARLPDPSFPGDQQQAALTTRGPRKRGLKGRKLALAVEEWRAL